MRTHPDDSNLDQKNPLAILLIHLLFSRIIKLEISTADFVGRSVYHVDVHETFEGLGHTHTC